jgi:drug/metabolite transporter (DMT)-like permease
MNWFFLALFSTTLFSITAFFDKYLVSKFFKKKGAAVLTFFTALTGVLLLPVILIIKPDVSRILIGDIIILTSSGIIFVFALLPYYLVLRKEDVSSVTPYYQAIPVFAYLLGLLFLHEQLTILQIIASLLIVLGAIGLTIDRSAKASKVNWRVFWLMMASVLMYALNSFAFKFVEERSDFWTTSFWEYVGFALAAAAILAIKKYRRQVAETFRVNAKKIVAISLTNDIIYLTGKVILNYASLLAPLALVSVVGSAQPFVVLILGVVLTILMPKIFKEDISRRTLTRKAAFIVLIIAGAVILNFY